jgi:hypothetical protein
MCVIRVNLDGAREARMTGRQSLALFDGAAAEEGRKIRRICRTTKVAQFGAQDIEIARAPIESAHLVG